MVKQWVKKDNTLSNMLNLFFFHDLEGVYQRTHVKKHEGVTKHSAQTHVWRIIHKTVKNMLCSCACVPPKKPEDVTNNDSWVKSIWEMPAKIMEDAKNSFMNELNIPLSHSTMAVNNFTKIVDGWLKKDPTCKMLELPSSVPHVLLK
eukprot:14096737-Ditylum_brightwellii.AAC.1